MPQDTRAKALAAELRIKMRAADLGALDWSPLDVLTEVAMGYDVRPLIIDPTTGQVVQEAETVPIKSIELRMAAAKELSPYVAPRLKAVEITNSTVEDAEARRLDVVGKILDVIGGLRGDQPVLPPPDLRLEDHGSRVEAPVAPLVVDTQDDD
jgi:hypothetical protein